MKKILMIFLVFLSSLFYANASTYTSYGSYGSYGVTCTGANVCSNYNVDCREISDGFCPEKYGDWSLCDEQTYGKCAPCDPDCGTCGTLQLIAPSKVNPCARIDFIAKAELSNTPDTIAISRGLKINDPTYSNSLCERGETNCKRTFSGYGVSCKGGDDSCLTATTEKLKPGVKATKCIQVNPEVKLTAVSGIIGSYGAYGSVNFNFNIKSLQGVTKYKSYLYKKDSKTNSFRPVNVNLASAYGSYCSFKCDPNEKAECNLFASDIVNALPNEHSFNFNFDTTKCDNKEFKIESFGYDNRNNFNKAEMTFILENQNPPCIDQCFLFNSEVLNTIQLKIKSWIS